MVPFVLCCAAPPPATRGDGLDKTHNFYQVLGKTGRLASLYTRNFFMGGRLNRGIPREFKVRNAGNHL
jgi:hypothetical protein